MPAVWASAVTRATGIGGCGKTVNVSAFDVPPPPPVVGVVTVTGTIAAAARSVDKIAAFTPAGLANVVVRGLPFHCTTEHGTRLPPLVLLLASTPRMNAADPTCALAGKSLVIAGTGSAVVTGEIVNGEDAEASAGNVELETVTFIGPGNATSSTEIAAVSCVALTKDVARGEPFQLTTSPLGTKFVPFTVSVIPDGPQATVLFAEVEDADSDVMVGSTTGNETAFETVVPAAGLATATCAV